jgi:HSP20 family molecular chaperone IbpA
MTIITKPTGTLIHEKTTPLVWTQGVEFLGQTHVLRDDNSLAQISLNVPHLNVDELQVELTGNKLIVTGDTRHGGYVEKFERHFVVNGVEASDVKANLHDGILTLL